MAARTNASTHPHPRVSIPYVSKDVEDLLLWRNPKITAAVFGGITTAYVTLDWLKFSVLAVLCRLLLIAVGLSFAWNNVASFTGRPGVPVPKIMKEGISEREVQGVAKQLTPLLNKFLSLAHRLISGKEVVFTGQVALALFVIAKITSWLDTLDLLYLVTFLAFTVPKVYELKKDEIDSVVAKATHEVKVLYQKHVAPIVAKIPSSSTSGVKAGAPARTTDYTAAPTAHTTAPSAHTTAPTPAFQGGAPAPKATHMADDALNRFQQAVPQEFKKGL